MILASLFRTVTRCGRVQRHVVVMLRDEGGGLPPGQANRGLYGQVIRVVDPPRLSGDVAVAGTRVFGHAAALRKPFYLPTSPQILLGVRPVRCGFLLVPRKSDR